MDRILGWLLMGLYHFRDLSRPRNRPSRPPLTVIPA